jgi:hypothetical protein
MASQEENSCYCSQVNYHQTGSVCFVFIALESLAYGLTSGICPSRKAKWVRDIITKGGMEGSAGVWDFIWILCSYHALKEV